MKLILKLSAAGLLFFVTTMNTHAQNIFEAIQGGELSKVIEILNSNPEMINYKMNNGKSTLFYATENGKTEIAEYLISKGADPDFVFLDDYYGITPMTNAIVDGNFEMVKMMHEKGANILYKTKLGVNYLHYAAAKNHIKIIEYLLSNGLDINSITNGGLTAMHYAAIYNSEEALKLLIQKGAELNLKSNDGGTALHYAIASHNNNIADLLRQNGAKDIKREFPLYEGKYLGQTVPGSEPEPFVPELFRDIYRSYSIPVFSPDGKEVFWYGYFLPRSGYSRIWWMREEDGKWTAPELAPFSDFAQFSPGMSPDGKRLYFSSSNPVEGKKTTDADLWYAEKLTDGTWSEAKHLGFPPNREGYSEMLPVVANDGTIYFRAFGPGTRGIKMFKSVFSNNKYQQPQSIDDLIDQNIQDECKDIKQLITYEYGGPRYAEVSVCFHKSDGLWTKPIYLGDKIHQGQGTSNANLSPDGKFLFFVQNICPYWIDAKIIEEIKIGD